MTGVQTCALPIFLLRWLKVDHVPDVTKDTERFPEFNAVLANDLRTSLELFLDEVLSSESADFRQLLLADSLSLNGRLAKFYGVDLPEDAPFQLVPLDSNERAGVLSHPYLMAGFAYTATSSPIHRGVFIARSMLGRTLRPPPEAVTPLAAELRPDLTTRDRVALQTKPESCQSCHAMINPLGFTLEHFDAVGRFRKEELGKPIVASRIAVDTFFARIATFVSVSALRWRISHLRRGGFARSSAKFRFSASAAIVSRTYDFFRFFFKFTGFSRLI